MSDPNNPHVGEMGPERRVGERREGERRSSLRNTPDRRADDRRAAKKAAGPRISRRKLLTGAAIGGGLLIAWAAWPRSYPGALTPSENEHGFGAWLTIGTDGVVTVALPQLEMGQGVSTLLPQMIAAELGADWRQVGVQPVPPSGAYANVPLAAAMAPLWMPLVPSSADDPDDWPDSWISGRFAGENGFNATAFGTTLAAYEDECRHAAATARGMLATAAAELWDVDWTEVEIVEGIVRNGDREIGFGELAAAAAEVDPIDPPPLFPENYQEEPELVGGPQPITFPRLDAPSKVDGSHQFAGDVRLPEMVFASIRHAPPGGELAEFDEARAGGLRGLVGVVQSKRWLAAAADNWWTAERALERMRPRFRSATTLDTDEIEEALVEAANSGQGHEIAANGDWSGDVPETDFTSVYTADPAVHAPIETATATARYDDGKLELWIAAQSPSFAREAAAKAVDVSPRDVILYPVSAGGSFDARLDHNHAIQVAVLAKELGRPVQLMYSRRQELIALPARTPFAARLDARMRRGAGSGQVERWQARYAMPATMREFGHRLFDNYTRESAIEAAEGEVDRLAVGDALAPYGVEHSLVEHVPVAIPLPTGPMRGNSAALAAFPRECFIDELAARAGREPLSFRISMLGRKPRLVACLQQAAAMANWDGARRSSGQGIACLEMGLGSAEDAPVGRIACIAEAGPGEGGIEVSRLYAAVDLGRIVNLDLARQQVEGGLIFGLSLVLGSTLRYSGGQPSTTRLSGLRLPTIGSVPEIDVAFLKGDGPAFDPGEIGAAIVAPAVANAMFSATGRRLRHLPLTRVAAPPAEPPPSEAPPAPSSEEVI